MTEDRNTMEEKLQKAREEWEAAIDDNADSKKIRELKKSMDDCIKEMKKIKEDSEKYKNIAQRLQAEHENYLKRTEKEKLRISEDAVGSFICRLLPVLDSFQQAIKSSEDEGLRLIYQQFEKVLTESGLEEIKCVHEPFNPYMHEALMKEVSDEDNIVLDELQKGYKIGERVIRHSKVKVGVKDENKERDSKGDSTEDSE
ncbi:nucleotide exchange factor GrpE [Candidatus Woesearchaeota archaeon]|nr:nucleotide exchange factor GrpE [Candidatus Woesearchaeota archaeon]